MTSHSPELRDDTQIDVNSIVAVDAEGGITRLARPDSTAAAALRDKLYTPGELSRVNQLLPAPDSAFGKLERDLGRVLSG